MQQHISMGLILFPCLRPASGQHMIFPMFILCVKFVIALDMLDQGTVPISKVLPSFVAVRLTLKNAVNAELGFVIAHIFRVFRIQPGVGDFMDGGL